MCSGSSISPRAPLFFVLSYCRFTSILINLENRRYLRKALQNDIKKQIIPGQENRKECIPCCCRASGGSKLPFPAVSGIRLSRRTPVIGFVRMPVTKGADEPPGTDGIILRKGIVTRLLISVRRCIREWLPAGQERRAPKYVRGTSKTPDFHHKYPG